LHVPRGARALRPMIGHAPVCGKSAQRYAARLHRAAAAPGTMQ